MGHGIFRVRDKKILTSALTVDPLYLQHEHDGKSTPFVWSYCVVMLYFQINIFQTCWDDFSLLD